MSERPPSMRPISPLRCREAANTYITGELSAQEVGALYGRSKRWVFDQVQRFGLRAKIGPGLRPVRRLALLPEIVVRLRAGASQRSITVALKFSVPALVWQVRNGHVVAPELLAVVGPARGCVRR